MKYSSLLRRYTEPIVVLIVKTIHYMVSNDAKIIFRKEALIMRNKKKNIRNFNRLVKLYKQSNEYFLYRASTQASIEASLANHLLPYFGTTRLDKLDTCLIEDWLYTLKETPPLKGGCYVEHLSESTIYNLWILLRRILEFACEKNILTDNPCNNVRWGIRPHLPSHAPSFIYDIFEFDRFLDQLFSQKKLAGKVKNALLALLILRSNTTVAKIYRLKWSDFNVKTGSITNRASNISLILDDLSLMLLQQHKVYQDEWLKKHPAIKNTLDYIFISTRYKADETVAKAPHANSFYTWLRNHNKKHANDLISVRSLQLMGKVYEMDFPDPSDKKYYSIIDSETTKYNITCLATP